MLQLLHMMDKWTDSLDDGGQVNVIYSDFAKAFDKVPHKMLISKLQAYSIDKSIVKWVSEFLHARKYRVEVNSSFSEWQDVPSGILQGSVLGPLLFIIYINNLIVSCQELSDVYVFADDAKFARHINQSQDCCELQEVIELLHKWSTSHWLLKLHVNKCHIVSFRTMLTKVINKSYGTMCHVCSGKNMRDTRGHKPIYNSEVLA